MKSRDFVSKNGIFRITINWYTIFCTLLTFGIIGLLLYTVPFLPKFGDPDSPTNHAVETTDPNQKSVPQRYVEDGSSETGAVNAVAGLILNYRGFDTFGEATILFVAVEGVMMLMRKKYNPELEEDDGDEITE